jgi:hypothetical protein
MPLRVQAAPVQEQDESRLEDRAGDAGAARVGTSHVARALGDCGLGRDDKVAQLVPNSLDTFVTFWGALCAGRGVVTSDP